LQLAAMQLDACGPHIWAAHVVQSGPLQVPGAMQLVNTQLSKSSSACDDARHVFV
jgi:hypothetical protein